MPAEPAARTQRSTAEGPAWLRLMRPRQWSKNLLVFAALVFADRLLVGESIGLATVAFAAFCAASSSVYVVNDLLDAERDRLHPKKRHRPIAAGQVGRAAAAALATALTAVALGLAVWIGPAFAIAIVVYVGLSHFYSALGKNVVILDTMLIATGFVLRAVGGALAIDVPSSDWFVLCTFFLALFLALSKRRAELIALEAGAGAHRKVLDEYTPATLVAFTSTSIGAVVISYALYVLNRNGDDGIPTLALTVPFVLFAVFRYHHLVETAGFGERPEDVFLRDRPFRWCVIGFAAVALGALYLGG